MAAEAAAYGDCDFRDMLSRVGDKWSLLVIATLERRPDRRARFSDLKRGIPGISQRMLTATVRHLERDGMLTRHMYPEIPPRQRPDGSRTHARVVAAIELACDSWRTRALRLTQAQLTGFAQG
jgi:DNA-binding HxlR family transcriptional regulator